MIPVSLGTSAHANIVIDAAASITVAANIAVDAAASINVAANVAIDAAAASKPVAARPRTSLSADC